MQVQTYNIQQAKNVLHTKNSNVISVNIKQFVGFFTQNTNKYFSVQYLAKHFDINVQPNNVWRVFVPLFSNCKKLNSSGYNLTAGLLSNSSFEWLRGYNKQGIVYYALVVK